MKNFDQSETFKLLDASQNHFHFNQQTKEIASEIYKIFSKQKSITGYNKDYSFIFLMRFNVYKDDVLMVDVGYLTSQDDYFSSKKYQSIVNNYKEKDMLIHLLKNYSTIKEVIYFAFSTEGVLELKQSPSDKDTFSYLNSWLENSNLSTHLLLRDKNKSINKI